MGRNRRKAGTGEVIVAQSVQSIPWDFNQTASEAGGISKRLPDGRQMTVIPYIRGIDRGDAEEYDYSSTSFDVDIDGVRTTISTDQMRDADGEFDWERIGRAADEYVRLMGDEIPKALANPAPEMELSRAAALMRNKGLTIIPIRDSSGNEYFLNASGGPFENPTYTIDFPDPDNAMARWKSNTGFKKQTVDAYPSIAYNQSFLPAAHFLVDAQQTYIANPTRENWQAMKTLQDQWNQITSNLRDVDRMRQAYTAAGGVLPQPMDRVALYAQRDGYANQKRNITVSELRGPQDMRDFNGALRLLNGIDDQIKRNFALMNRPLTAANFMALQIEQQRMRQVRAKTMQRIERGKRNLNARLPDTPERREANYLASQIPTNIGSLQIPIYNR